MSTLRLKNEDARQVIPRSTDQGNRARWTAEGAPLRRRTCPSSRVHCPAFDERASLAIFFLRRMKMHVSSFLELRTKAPRNHGRLRVHNGCGVAAVHRPGSTVRPEVHGVGNEYSSLEE